MAQRLGRKRAYAAMFVGTGCMQLLWAATGHPWALAVFALLFGAFYGGFVAMAPSIMADYFGLKALGAVLGAQYASVAIGVLLGPPVAGFLFDFSGVYLAAILVGAALAFAGAVLVVLCPEAGPWRRARDAAG